MRCYQRPAGKQPKKWSLRRLTRTPIGWHEMSQERLAELLCTKQANVSRMERRTDMWISTLRSYIEAMGGELDIVARFPDGDVHMNQFEDIDGKRDEQQASHL